MRRAKKRMPLIASLALLLLLNACYSNLPYKVWRDWDDMKKGLGDHYLYPTYLPEFTEFCENKTFSSDYNNAAKPDGTTISHSYPKDDPFCGYAVSYITSHYGDDRFFFNAIDFSKMRRERTPNPDGYEVYHQVSETYEGTVIEYNTRYMQLISTDERIVLAEFICDGITYWAYITQYDVADKYADDDERAELFLVAKSVIDQRKGS